MRLDSASEEALTPELQPGERALWSGRPGTERWFVPSDLFLIPFSLMWGGFAIFWEASALIAKTPSGSGRYGILFQLWGLPFVAIGLYMIFGRFIARRYFGRRTAYAITDRRALVLKPTWRGGRHLTSVWLVSAPPVSQRATRRGNGTVLLGSMPMSQMASFVGDPGWILGGGSSDTVVVFWNISDAAEVGGLATRVISEARPERARPSASF